MYSSDTKSALNRAVVMVNILNDAKCIMILIPNWDIYELSCYSSTTESLSLSQSF